MNITQKQLDRLKETLACGSQGNWEVKTTPQGSFGKDWREIHAPATRQWVVSVGQYHSSRDGDVAGVRIAKEDAESIVELHNLAPALIAAAEEGLKLQARVRELEEALKDALDHVKKGYGLVEDDNLSTETTGEECVKRAEYALSTFQPQEPRSEWKDISEAPEGEGKYFFCFLAWGPEDDRTTASGFRWNNKWFACPVFYNGSAFNECQMEMRQIEVIPTHFMPLPANPQPNPSRS